MNVQEKYQRLEDTIRQYNPGANLDLIRSAFHFAEEHHRGQNRKDGSPFVTHPLAVAQIVAGSCIWIRNPLPPPCSTTPLRTHLPLMRI